MFATLLLRRCLCSSSSSNVDHQPHVLLKFWWDALPSSFVPCGSLLVGLLPLVIAHCHFSCLSLVAPFCWACFHWPPPLLLIKYFLLGHVKHNSRLCVHLLSQVPTINLMFLISGDAPHPFLCLWWTSFGGFASIGYYCPPSSTQSTTLLQPNNFYATIITLTLELSLLDWECSDNHPKNLYSITPKALEL
jgi:hypothetical protein